MDHTEQYLNRGATCVRGLYPRELAHALAYQLSLKVRSDGPAMLAPPTITNKACYESCGSRSPGLLTFLWGLTPRVELMTGEPVLPTYAYFRTYQKGDICRIHCDRGACEHSVSLTLAYSDDIPWALEVGRNRVPEDQRKTKRGEDDFGSEESTAFAMEPGDAVFYHGVEFLHGRTQPNPNRWSVHLFMHWVSRNGPHADQAFDGKPVHGRIDFRFPREPESADIL